MAETTILDLCSLSITFPSLPQNLIPRELFLDNFEMELNNSDVLFVKGQRQGCGVTIALAQFAMRHNLNSVSYFNSGLNLYLTEPEEISNSLAQQLYFYNVGEKYTGDILDIESQLLALAKTTRKRNQCLYFIFDGFSRLPQDKVDSIRQLLRKLFTCGAVKFIFSGEKADFEDFIEETSLRTSELGILLPFDRHASDDYFRYLDSQISDDDALALFKFTEGLAIKMDYVSYYYKENCTFEPFLTSETKSIEQLYTEDFQTIPHEEDFYKVLALVAFAGIPLRKEAISDLLEMPKANLTASLSATSCFLQEYSDGIVGFRTNSAHRFIKKRLVQYEQLVGSLMIDFFEREQSKYLIFIPALYRKFKKGQLLHFLQSPAVQQILIDQKSQAALNVQCNLGYKESVRNRNLPELYTFSLYKSMSNEIERNELWDNEIEALTSVGDFESALTLAETAYLDEEKLKSYTIIAHSQREKFGNIDPVILQKISELNQTIRYEDIPDKSLELARLLLTVDYKLSLEITDRIVKSDEGKDMSKIMSMMSLSALAGYGKPTENTASYDIFASRIEDEEVKSQTEAMKSLFTDASVDEFIGVLKTLPNSFQQLHLLQYWVSTNKKKPNIFKAVQLGFDLVIQQSSEKVPRAAMVSRLCDALPYLNDEELDRIIEMIDSIRSDIRYPSESFTMVQMKVIRAIAPKDIHKAVERLKVLTGDIKLNSNNQIAVNCKALILRDYKKLYNVDYVAEHFMSENALLNEIENQIHKLFRESAYQDHIIETPVKALVTDYPSFMMDIAPKLNTEWQRSKAYSMSSIEYVRQMKLQELDFDYLKKMVDEIKYPASRAEDTWLVLVRKCYNRKSEAKSVLPELKKLDSKFNAIKDYNVKSEIFARLYVIFKDEDGYSPYDESLLRRACESCEDIQIERVKIERGFMMARVVASVNQQAAKEIILQTQDVKTRHILSSLSCGNTYQMSLNLYLNALGALIRAGYATDENIMQYESIINQIDVSSETIRYWSDLALNYWLYGDETKFRKYIRDKVVNPFYDVKGSERNRKMLLFSIAPSLFLYDENLFFSLINGDDDPYFCSSCIDHVIKFILFRNTEASDVEDSMVIVNLVYEDCLKLVTLLKHCVDDEIIFATTDTICRSVLKTGKKTVWSNPQRNNIRDMLTNIIETNLPAPLGISHQGYLLACKAAVRSLDRPSKDYFLGLRAEIDDIPNTADQAFIYIYLTRFMEDMPSVRNEFIRRGLDISKTLPAYDKVQRMEMCLKEVKSEKDKLKSFAVESFLNIITDGDHSFENCRKVIDIAQMHDTSISQSLSNIIDEDPARRKYKEELNNRVERNKRIEDAKKTPSEVLKLSEEELLDFFHFEYNNQLLGKSIVWSEDRIFDYIQPSFNHPLSTTYEGFLTIAENISKMSDGKRKKALLLKLYSGVFWNLKMVIALASGTKDKLDRLNNAIRETFAKSDTIIRIGERSKAVEKIMSWSAQSHSNELKIVDAYFNPDDLHVIKELFNQNNDLHISILTLRRNAPDINRYQDSWDLISSDMTGSLTIRTVCYKDSANDGPIHDRWWLAGNDDNISGICSSSISTLGAKETAFAEMTADQILVIIDEWNDYFTNKVRSVNGKSLRYNELEIM